MLNQEAKTLSVVNLSVLDQKAGPVKEVKLLEEDGNAKQLNIKTKTMEKGHYGQYTGNARHSRKEEMIHDRELISDAKKQLHHADQDYKHDSPAHRALVGDQNKLPGHLKKAISDAPAQMNADLAYDPINDRADSPMSMYGKKESPAKNMKNVLSGKQRY